MNVTGYEHHYNYIKLIIMKGSNPSNPHLHKLIQREETMNELYLPKNFLCSFQLTFK